MSTQAPRSTWVIRVGMAHRRLFICVALGLLAILLLRATDLGVAARVLIGWDVGVMIYLVVVAIIMARSSTVAAIKRNASLQDEGAFAILVLTVAAALASLGAIFLELAGLRPDDPRYGF